MKQITIAATFSAMAKVEPARLAAAVKAALGYAMHNDIEDAEVLAPDYVAEDITVAVVDSVDWQGVATDFGAALELCVTQIEQMKGMFDDSDGAIQAALAEAYRVADKAEDLVAASMRDKRPSAPGQDGTDFGLSEGQLDAKYGDEHPVFPRSAWQQEVGEGNTRVGYWTWVMHQVESHYSDACDVCGKDQCDKAYIVALGYVCKDCAGRVRLNDAKSVLATIVEYVFEHDEWWNELVADVALKCGEEELTSWLSFAQSATTEDMVKYALTKYVQFVHARPSDWLETSYADCLENELYYEAATAIGVSLDVIAGFLRGHGVPENDETEPTAFDRHVMGQDLSQD